MTSTPSLAIRELQLDLGNGQGSLSVAIISPPSAPGVAIVARGNGNGSPSHQPSFPMFLLASGLAIAACDILTQRERQAAQRSHRAARNVRLLSDRLTGVIDLVRQQADIGNLPLGLVAAGTLAAAALDVASFRPLDVDAVVCRNGRLDLATAVDHVQTPTLLVVATDQPALVRINDEAFQRLTCAKHLDVIPSGPTAPEDLRSYRLSAELARDWLLTYLRMPAAA